jgi:hypothetical protein
MGAYIGEQCKSHDEENEEQEIGGIVQEGGGEGEEEEQAEEYAQCGDHLSVDETLLRPARAGLMLVEPLAGQTCDN